MFCAVLQGCSGVRKGRTHAKGVVQTRALRKGTFLPSMCLLDSPLLEPLLRTILSPFAFKSAASHLLRTLLRTFLSTLENLLRTLLRRRVVA